MRRTIRNCAQCDKQGTDVHESSGVGYSVRIEQKFSAPPPKPTCRVNSRSSSADSADRLALARPVFHVRDNWRGFRHANIDKIDSRVEVAAVDACEGFGDHALVVVSALIDDGSLRPAAEGEWPVRLCKEGAIRSPRRHGQSANSGQ